MANPKDMDRASLGKEAWNDWAQRNPEAKVDFSRASFYTADFRGFIFPGDANFEHCRFAEEADFRDCRFLGVTQFAYAAFKRQANFSDTSFRGYLGLDRIKFDGDALFENSTFEAYTYIVHSDFRYANFRSAAFNEHLEVTHSTFRGEVDFSRATFHSATFRGVSFEHPLTTFEATTFHKVPDFRSSTFKPAAIFHRTHVVGDWTGRWWNRRAVGSDDAEKYRRLKVLATDAKDHGRELDYFADELRAKRGHETKGPAVFLNVAYGGVSDFARSVARPFLILIALTLAVWVVRLAGCWPRACTADALLALSITDGGLLLGLDKSAIRESAKAICGQSSFVFQMVAYLQSIASVVLLFLIALGLRNRFRIGSGN